MANLSSCLQRAQLAKLAGGQYAPHELEPLLEHLQQCDTCLRQAQALSDSNTLVEFLGKVKTLSPEVDDPALQGIMDRLAQLAQPSSSAGVTFACPQCGKKLKAEAAGKKVKCPGCGQAVPVPAPRRDVSEQPTVMPDAPAPTASEATPPTAAPTGEALDFLRPAEQADELGRLGPYRLLQKLGAGGMGMVFLAEDTLLRRKVALKLMLPQFAASAPAKERFLREARSAASTEHEHIVAIHQVGEDNGVPFLAMPLLKGEPLDVRLAREGKLPVAEALRIAREMAEGLAAAHASNLIHRDIKPGNVWLEGQHGKVRLLDFGLARAQDDQAHLTQTGAVIGTPAYMAPEQARGAKIDGRADLFSLGCVLYQMLTGQRPFQGNDTIALLMALATDTPPAPASLHPDVPKAASDLTMQLLSKDAVGRPASAEQVAEELAALAGGAAPPRTAGRKAPASATQVLSAPAAGRWRRVPWLPVAAIVALLGLACGAVVLFWPTAQGVVRVEINDPSLKVSCDDKELTFHGLEPQDLRVAPGPHGLVIRSGKLEFASEKFQVKKGETVALKVELLKDGMLQVVQGDRVLGEKALARVGPATAAPGAARHAAEWALASGGGVRIRLGDKEQEIAAGTSLPAEDFQLTMVRFWGNPGVTDDDLVRLQGLTSLTHVGLNYVPVGDAGLAHLRGLTDLTFLGLKRLNVTDAGLAVVKELPSLTELSLTELSGITGTFLVHVKGLNKLTKLDLAGCKQVRTGLEHLPRGITWLRPSSTQLSDLSPLKGMALTFLDCSYTPLGDADLEPIRALSNLTELLLNYTAVSDAGLIHLKACKKLIHVGLEKTRVTPRGIEELRQALPRCKIDADASAPVAATGHNLVLGHPGEVWSVALSGDGQRVLTGGVDETAILWDAARGQKSQTFQGSGVALSADSKLVLTASPDKTARLWEAASGKKIQTFQGHTHRLNGIALSGDGQRVLTGYDDNTAILWEAASGQKLQTFQGHAGGVLGVALSADGQQVLTGSVDSSVILWEAASAQKIKTFPGPSPVRSVALSGDGKRILAGYTDHTAILWDAASGDKLHTFRGHTREVYSVALSRDARFAVTGSEDNTAILWDAANGARIRLLQGHSNTVTGVALSHDGKYVLTGSRDGTAILWKIDAPAAGSSPP